MKQRSAKQLMIDVMPELENATAAYLIVKHGDGTISRHQSSNSLSDGPGLLRYATVVTEDAVRLSENIPYTQEKETLQ